MCFTISTSLPRSVGLNHVPGGGVQPSPCHGLGNVYRETFQPQQHLGKHLSHGELLVLPAAVIELLEGNESGIPVAIGAASQVRPSACKA